MPRDYLMTWVASRLGWMKEYRGKKYAVSCRQLFMPATKEGSYQAANAWWKQKRATLDLKAQAAARQPQPLEDLMTALHGPEVFTDWREMMHLIFQSFLTFGMLPAAVTEEMRKSLEKGYPKLAVNPQVWDELGRMLTQVTGQEVARTLVAGESLPGLLQENLSPARLHQLQDAASMIRGEGAASSETLVQAYFERWFEGQQIQATSGKITADRVDNKRIMLVHFVTWLGLTTEVTAITEARVEDFYNWCQSKIAERRQDKKAGWSQRYTRAVFDSARAFIRYLWTSRAIPDLPRNLSSFSFDVTDQIVPVWTVADVQHVFSQAPEKLHLQLLLMLNCGMTQTDISDLLDTEVDWLKGRITRKRSKTRDINNVPQVCYPLWSLTSELLQKYRSGQEHVLLTAQGLCWVRKKLVEGKLVKADGIASNFTRLQQKLDFARPLKQLRKTGASMLENHPVYGRYAGLYLGHAPENMRDKHYVIPSQTLFDEAIHWLGEQFGFVTNINLL